MTDDPIARAAALLRERPRALALTGAGLSVDSGIPDFRSPGGLWAKYEPMEYATIEAFGRDPEKVWRMLIEVDELIHDAAPNRGHRALAELQALGFLESVVTQNIDGLHQRAGTREVIEFHGGADRLVCLDCQARVTAEDYAARRASGDRDIPRCPQCSAILKPDVVFFGEAIPSGALQKAFERAAACDAVLVVGTSATVSPAAEVPLLAKEKGAVLLEFNLELTPLSGLADVCVPGSASETLPALVAALRA